jgi:hypothetical protein
MLHCVQIFSVTVEQLKRASSTCDTTPVALRVNGGRGEDGEDEEDKDEDEDADDDELEGTEPDAACGDGGSDRSGGINTGIGRRAKRSGNSRSAAHACAGDANTYS